ncbi:Nicotinate-nucleotide adenylyltransferase [Paraliobacillus sp. PM-2]|uniref:nicotinate-nucleotide adenylyltransferase n=1 Tax=Paraliobacillus sp. PM-2 TaxID=1462524 RepID=UPI00061C530B|nr:nicotinate-nucleotide adenylyltransferase [Paraliobacillus sp. PM-2]CQR46913.1 Nicotinate-nucleotide adenylyltransferase [Paraliobacillus sp. PM-2]
MKKVGLLGGTFDPPHIGHLVIAEEVYHQLKLDEVWFIPSNEPPHKDKASTAVINRVAMVEAAIDDNDHFFLKTIEIDRPGKSYTFNTIHLLKEIYPDTSFYFIIGADMVEYLPKWNKIDELINMVKFVGVKRPEYELDTNYPIIAVDIPGLDISSTMIRNRVKQNKPITYFVPSSVRRLIKENRLYESSERTRDC